MLVSTWLARARDSAGLTCGANFVGALNRPDSSAASARVDLAHRFAEIELRGRFDAEGAAAHIGAVEIELEHLGLG